MTAISDPLSQGLLLAALFSGIPLLVSTFVSLVLSIVQAATQIQDQSLTFLPRLVAVCLTLFLISPWMVEKLRDYLELILQDLPML